MLDFNFFSTLAKTDYSTDQSSIEDVLFKLSLNGVNKVLFERESFLNMHLFASSTFQVHVSKFDEVMLGKSSFSGMAQQRGSNFELNLMEGKDIKLSDGLFADLIQSDKSKFIVNFGLDAAGYLMTLKFFHFFYPSQNR